MKNLVQSLKQGLVHNVVTKFLITVVSFVIKKLKVVFRPIYRVIYFVLNKGFKIVLTFIQTILKLIKLIFTLLGFPFVFCYWGSKKVFKWLNIAFKNGINHVVIPLFHFTTYKRFGNLVLRFIISLFKLSTYINLFKYIFKLIKAIIRFVIRPFIVIIKGLYYFVIYFPLMIIEFVKGIMKLFRQLVKWNVSIIKWVIKLFKGKKKGIETTKSNGETIEFIPLDVTPGEEVVKRSLLEKIVQGIKSFGKGIINLTVNFFKIIGKIITRFYHLIFNPEGLDKLTKKITSSLFYKVKYSEKEALYGYMFVSLFIIGSVVFLIRPIIQSIQFSFNSVTSSGLNLTWKGLFFYKEVLTNEAEYIQLLTDSLLNLITDIPIIIAFSLFIAIILNQKFRGRFLVRAIFFLPFVLSSGVILNILKEDLFNAGIKNGSENMYIFQAVGLQEILINSGFPSTVVNYFTGIVNRIFDLSWKIGVQTLLFLAALQTIPHHLYEAAIVEGATNWERFWKISFPIISPYIFVNIIYTIIDIFTDYSNPMMNYIQDNFNAGGTDFYSLHAVRTWVYFLLIMIILSMVYLLLRKRIVRLN